MSSGNKPNTDPVEFLLITNNLITKKNYKKTNKEDSVWGSFCFLVIFAIFLLLSLLGFV